MVVLNHSLSSLTLFPLKGRMYVPFPWIWNPSTNRTWCGTRWLPELRRETMQFLPFFLEIHFRAVSSLVMSSYLDTTIQERPPVGFWADSPRQICPSVISGHVPEMWMKMPSWKWGLWPQLILLPAVWIIPAQTLWCIDEPSLLCPFQIPDTQNPCRLLFNAYLSPFEMLYQNTTDWVS